MFDEKMANILTPDYPLGCKRILLSDNLEYYQTLRQSHVQLITDPITGLTQSGILTQNQSFNVDTIIYATGFAIGKNLHTIEGKNGAVPDSETPEAYWGITFAGFPNYFTLLGPNTALGHNSVVWMVECQVTYIMDCIAVMITGGVKQMEIKKEKVDHWYSQILPKFKSTVWTGSCRSWYQNKNGRIIALWPSSTFSYWWGLLQASKTIKEDYHAV